MQQIEPVTLSDREYAINYNQTESQGQLEYYVKHAGREIDINGSTLSLAEDGLYNHVYYNTNVLLDGGTLIIPQHMAESLELSRQVWRPLSMGFILW